MIFRYLCKHRVKRAFGAYITPEALDNLLTDFDEMTEWQAMKFLLPARFVYDRQKREKALMEVRRMSLEVLSKSEPK
jgi:hypothetical protein